MGLSVTGFDANGRIIPKGVNVVIPPENAGVGDLIFKASATDFIVIGRGTANGTSITVNGKNYTRYAGIYGFVNGEAMIVAPEEGGSKKWANDGVSIPSGVPTYGWGTVLMRNRLKHTYAQMNTARNSGYIKGGTTAPLQLASAYQATTLTKETFDTDASNEIKVMYKTWEEYIRQTLRVNGVPGTPFGAKTTGVKVHEFGKWMTDKIKSTDYPAGNYCATYKGAFDTENGKWWLPSMFELAELMIDDHLNKLNENPTSVFAAISVSSYRWSCVLYSSTLAWYYNYYGLSVSTGFSDEFAVRPVSLFRLK